MTTMTPHSIYKEIGALIKVRRKTLRLKQEDLSGQLGISRGSLANIETGRQSILVHQLYHFAKALQLRPTDLLPQDAPESTSVQPINLPLPTDLKGVQKEQVANFFSNADTNNPAKTGGDNAKPAKR